MMVYAADDKDFDTSGESRMMPPLVDWLRRKRWVREDTLLVREFPVNGRRADLVTMTRSGVISSFELKLGGFARVLEQASYNRQTFDRSWVVVGSIPRLDNLAEAERFGIGLIVITDGAPRILVHPGPAVFDRVSRLRALTRLRNYGGVIV